MTTLAATATSEKATTTGEPIITATGHAISTSPGLATDNLMSTSVGINTNKSMTASIDKLPASVANATGGPLSSSATTTDTGIPGEQMDRV